MKDIIMALLISIIVVLVIILGNSGDAYKKGYQAGLNYTPPAMSRIDSLTIPEFTPAERRIISQFMLIIKKASEVKE